MYHYDIALLVKIDSLFSYKYSTEIKKGCRVIVSFGNTVRTGIVWQQSKRLSSEIKYKNILEIIDKEPIINEELLYIAKWISNYYSCSLGHSLFSMLPTGLNIQLQQKIKKIKDGILKESNGFSERIMNELSSIVFTDISDIKDKLKMNDFYYWIEQMEEAGLVEIERVYDARIKKKIANFIVLNKLDKIPHLVEKQESAFNIIKNTGKDFPLAEIAHKFSYSIVKSLRNKGLIRIEQREIKSDYEITRSTTERKKIELTDEQKNIRKKIISSLDQNIFKTFLLYGITGSGKTEIYIHAINSCLKKGKTALLLVPEIALTPQMVQRFFHAFKEDIAILHSHLNDREKLNQWKKIRSGKCKIVIGARSAIFAPLENIGIIIIDEEHENSFKQDKTPRYNARDIAVVRAKKANAVVILGSATPSLESWQNTKSNKFQLLKLQKRPLAYQLPSVKIIDMKKEKDHKLIIAKELIKKIENRLSNKEQVILLQNRRGYSSFVQCISCGKLFKCPKCNISLKYHSISLDLICHYCGYKTKMPRNCPDCKNYLFKFGAPGTQQIEKHLKILFPTAKILRMDSDTTRKKDSYDSMFRRMQNGNIDILLGTQMIAKGLDFPNVTLVGVISADIGLNFPDFRAAEKTFQLLTQVAGRSGRGEKPGEVFIQTYNPEHYAITSAMKQDFELFAERELSLRKTLHYPPFYRIARMIFSGKDEKQLKTQFNYNKQIFLKLRTLFKPSELLVLGPVPAPIEKLKDNFRYHILLKASSVSAMSKAITFLKENLKISSVVKQTIDVDPSSLL